ncbi:MAG: rhomboid family intramembrane serine protease [Muribaculaceae bacterium]|nr:rhomboid family intramembrane serine protease [Muribaculaceae bacterium]
MTYSFRHIFRSAPVILITVNIVVFIIIAVVSLGGGNILSWLGLQSSFCALQNHPWTPLTYAFSQANLLQLIFNMLWLYCFGMLFMICGTARQLIALYILGALSGAVTYMSVATFFDISSPWLLMGSSAAVISIAVAVAMMMPDFEINLPLFGPTKIKWIVGFVVVIFLLGLSTPNAGGNLAHIGGVVAGVAGALIILSKKRRDNSNATDYDRLADKIRRSGFETLSAKERRRFFELSNKRK